MSLALKESTTIYGRHAKHSAIKEVFVLELRENDVHLDIPHLHLGDGNQWIHLKSIIL